MRGLTPLTKRAASGAASAAPYLSPCGRGYARRVNDSEPLAEVGEGFGPQLQQGHYPHRQTGRSRPHMGFEDYGRQEGVPLMDGMPVDRVKRRWMAG